MNFSSGTLFKIPLPFDFGFAYCRLDNYTNVSTYDGVVISVFDFFGEIDNKEPGFFENTPFFMNAIPIVKMPTLKGKYAWQKLGELSPGSFVLPAFKIPEINGFAWSNLSDYQDVKWFARVNLKEDVGPINFNQVRHLEELFIRSTVTIEQRIAMTILRHQKIDIEGFFNKHMMETYWKTDFKTQKFIPLYKNLPEEIRGRPLIRGFVPEKYLDFDWNNVLD